MEKTDPQNLKSCVITDPKGTTSQRGLMPDAFSRKSFSRFLVKKNTNPTIQHTYLDVWKLLPFLLSSVLWSGHTCGLKFKSYKTCHNLVVASFHDTVAMFV